jgi:murein DD-endopeptidase MepM/ murein hydrolase activator NlpD
MALCGVAVPAVGAATPPSQSGGTSASGSDLPPGDALTQQLNQAIAAQAKLDAARSALSGSISVARDEQSRMAQLVLDNHHQIDLTIQRIADEQRAVDDATHAAATAHAEVARDRAQIAADRATLGRDLRAVYEQDDNFITYLLGSDSFSDFMGRIEAMHQISGSVTTLLAQLHDLEGRAVREDALAQIAEQRARDMASALVQQKADLEGQIAREQKLIAQLGSDLASAMGELDAASNQTADLAQQIADLRIQQLDRSILDAEQAAWDEAQYYVQHNLGGGPSQQSQPDPSYTVTPPNGNSAGTVRPAPGSPRMQWPCYGTGFAQYFGPSAFPFEPPAFGYQHFHTGVDFAGPQGTPARATANGVVVAASKGDTGYGNHVVIAFDAHVLALYGHLDSFPVHVGDHVQAGQVIGLIGSTGNSTGPHLHFEVRYDDSPVDPMPLLPPVPDGANGPPAQPPGQA